MLSDAPRCSQTIVQPLALVHKDDARGVSKEWYIKHGIVHLSSLPPPFFFPLHQILPDEKESHKRQTRRPTCVHDNCVDVDVCVVYFFMLVMTGTPKHHNLSQDQNYKTKCHAN